MTAVTRLGLGTFALGWSIGVPGYPQPMQPMNAFDMLAKACDLGLSLVQFADNLPLHALGNRALDELREIAQDARITLELGMRGIQSPDFEQYIKLAQFFDAHLLRMVVDTATYQPTPDEIVALVQRQIPALEQAGVTLAIENHDRFKVETLASIIREINHPQVGICLDTVNSFGSLEAPPIVIETLGPHVVCLHVKDFVIRRADHNMGFIITGAAAGQGMLDIPWVMRSLQSHNRPFNAIIESWLAPTDDMDETAAIEQAWLRESVAYLRTFISE